MQSEASDRPDVSIQPKVPNVEMPRPRLGFPYFVLSGLMMAVGCYLLNVAAHRRQDELGPVLLLAGVFALYQWCATGLGVWLVRLQGRGSREARTLFGIAVLFLADLTVVYQELATAAPRLGLVVAGLATASGLLQLRWVTGRLGVALTDRSWALLGWNLALLLVLPAVLRLALQQGGWGARPGAALVLTWCLMGTAGLNVWAGMSWRNARGGRWWWYLITVTGVSMLLHAGSLFWVYELAVPVESMLTAGVLMASGILVGRATHWAGRLIGWLLLLPVLPDLVGRVGHRYPLEWSAGWLGDFNEWRLWLTVAGAMYGLIAWRCRRWDPVAVGIAGLLLATVPQHLMAAGLWLVSIGGDGLRWLAKVRHWGIGRWGTLLVSSAFALLALGGWASHRRGPRRPASP